MAIYIREAHADDEWDVSLNDWENVCYMQPTSMNERTAVARDFKERFSFEIPLLIDSMDDDAMRAYAAWPERLYVISADGTIAYRGLPGPWKLRPGRLERWLEERLGDE